MRKSATQAFERLSVPAGNRAVLCLDGGGIRGILTLQLLKALEAEAGCPCHQIFDMVAGTSTGGIIAGLIASRRTATEIDQLYKTLVAKVFTKRGLFSDQFINPPKWSKVSYRRALKEAVGNVTLQEACDQSELDLLVTAHDVAEGEQTFFSHLRGRPADRNRYAKVLLRAALEATMSAPTYFTPLERFVDGGTTTFNNPSLAAIIEAVQYGGNDYSIDHLTVFSFGTGCQTLFVKPDQVADPPGPDAAFWLKWLMGEAGNDASDMQSYLLRSKRILPGCDYRRFQISLDTTALEKLPPISLSKVDATDATTLHGLTDEELASIDLDNVAFFPVMQAIGEGLVGKLKQRAAANGHALFAKDLVDDRGHELLVTRSGEVSQILANLSDPNWLDQQEA